LIRVLGVLRSGKNGDDSGELLLGAPVVELVAFILALVGTNDASQMILFQQLVSWFQAELINVLASAVLLESNIPRILVMIDRVRPKQIGKETFWRRLLEAIDSLDLVERF
jgi:hypothetical protein